MPDDPQDERAVALPLEWSDALEDYLEALRVESGASRHTLAAYRGDLERFLRFARPRAADLAALAPEDILAHLEDSRRSGAAEATVARRLSAIRSFFLHLFGEGRIPSDPVSRITTPILRKNLPSTLSIPEVEALLAAPDGDSPLAQRDRAFLETLYASGARVSEAVGLRLEDIEPSLRVLTLTGKGRKTRIVPLGARARRALDTWIREGRAELAGPVRTQAVFLTKSGRPLDRRGAWRLVRRHAQAAGISRPISPHTLRHSFASHLIEGGADLRSVQEMLGHASIRTTEVYTHLDTEHVLSIHRLYHPRT